MNVPDSIGSAAPPPAITATPQTAQSQSMGEHSGSRIAEAQDGSTRAAYHATIAATPPPKSLFTESPSIGEHSGSRIGELQGGGGPAASTTPKPAPSSNQWTKENEDTVKADIAGALARNGNDVQKAFTDLRDKRQQPQNYYDSNLAIAADYLRARWDVSQHGAVSERGAVEAYLAAKQLGAVPQEGPGPVSPYSDLEAKYMRKGVDDQFAQGSLAEKLWDLPVPGIGLPVGFSKLEYDTAKPFLERLL